MNKSRLLWMLVAADVLFCFASVGAEGFFSWTLPPTLAEYQHRRFTDFSIARPGDVLHLLLLAATSLLAFAGWIGLASFWRHGRALYVVALASGFLLELFSGPSVRPSVSVAFQVLNCLVSGMILGLVFFSDLAHRFDGSTATTPAAGRMDLGTNRA